MRARRTLGAAAVLATGVLLGGPAGTGRGHARALEH
jgi:hypothetical protein